MKKKDARSFLPYEQEDLRLQAIELNNRSKYKRFEIAEKLGVSRQIVSKWIKAYKDGGRKALRPRDKGRPRKITLSKLQTAEINRIILDNTPDQLSLPFYLWNREAVAQLANRHLKLNLSISTLNRYLKIWKYVPHDKSARHFSQVIKNDLELFESVGESCLEKKYQSIYNQAKREKATIFWCSINFLRYDYPVTPTYDFEGTPVVRLSLGRRIKYSTISAIKNRGVIHFMVFRQKIKPPVLIDFLRRLIKQTNRRVFFMMDSHRIQRYQLVKEWLNDNSKQICLFPINWPIERI
jgi:transposase